MIYLCEQVDEFADGELSTEDAAVFRDHLANCAECQSELHCIMQLSAASAVIPGAVPKLAEVLPIRSGRRWAVVSALVAAAAIALLMLKWPFSAQHSGTPALALSSHLATHRAIEGRFGHQSLASHRPYVAMRSGTSPALEDVPPSVVAALEAQGDAHGVGVAYLLVGSTAQAEREFARLPQSTGVLVDRALLALVEGHAETSLEFLDSIPDEEQSPAALWNRAIALREMELFLLSAEAFERVSAFGEPGWSDEASVRAEALRARVAMPRARLATAIKAGTEFALGGEVPSLDVVSSAPGIARLYLYDAVRVAESTQRLDEMMPLAERLDEFYGETSLASLVENSMGALAKRAPLRARYLSLIGGAEMSLDGKQQLLADARTARDPLMLVGAILYATRPRLTVKTARVVELREAAVALEDSWFLLLAAEQHAQERIEAGDYVGVHEAIAEALPLCAKASAIDYRCLRLESAAGVAYAAFHQVSEARRVLESGWRRARKTGFTPYQVRFLQQMADLSLVSDQVEGSHSSLAQAYLQEALLRHDDCRGTIYAHEALAELLISQNRQGASVHMRAIAALQEQGCQSPMTLARALLLSQLGALGDAVEKLRGQALSPGQRAFADHVEGRALLATKRDEGRALLRRSIERANAIENADIYATKARAFSYMVLAIDSGEHGDYDSSLELLSEELGATPASRCSVGVVEGDGLVAIVRGHNGRTSGRYIRSNSAHTAAPTVLTAELVASLQGCELIDVFARPPHFGEPGLLPASVAWRYRVRGHVTARSSSARKLLVISDVDTPKKLGLAALRAQVRQGAMHLRGAEATPRRVLQAMETATFIEFHVHGVVQSHSSPFGSGAGALILSPDPDGTFMLRSAAIREHRLRGAPLVLLASCHGGASEALLHERESLVTALLDAGASAVIASPTPMPDTEAGAFFAGIAARVEAGTTASIALRDERAEWAKAAPTASWVHDLTVFE